MDEQAEVVEEVSEQQASDLRLAVDPSTGASELQRIAAAWPAARPLVAAHPHAYPTLLRWLAEVGDPAVDAALERRALAAAGPVVAISRPVLAPPVPHAVDASARHASTRQRGPSRSVESSRLVGTSAKTVNEPEWPVVEPLPPATRHRQPAAPGDRFLPDSVPESAPELDPGADPTSPATPATRSSRALLAGAVGLVAVATCAVVLGPRLLADRPTFTDGAELAWQVTAAELADSNARFTQFSPWVVDGTVVAEIDPRSGDAASLVGLDPATGERRWSAEVGGCEPWGAAHLACLDVAGEHPVLRRVAAADGEIVSSLELTRHDGGLSPTTRVFLGANDAVVTTTSAFGSDHVLTVVTSSGEIVADAVAGVGTADWAVVADNGTSSMSTTVDGVWRNIVRTREGEVALELVGSAVYLAPDGTLFHGSSSGAVQVSDAVPAIELPESGWAFDARDESGGRSLVMRTSEGAWLLLDPETGEAVHRLGVEGAASADVIVTRGLVAGEPSLLVCTGDELAVLSLEDPTAPREVPTDASCGGYPWLSNGVLLDEVGEGSERFLAATDPLTGERVWQVDLGDLGVSTSGPGVITVVDRGGNGTLVVVGGIVPAVER